LNGFPSSHDHGQDDPQLLHPPSTAADVTKLDDLPPSLRSNVDIVDEPLTRKKGEQPAWSDVIAFLQL
jgi:cytochrome c peroxidase